MLEKVGEAVCVCVYCVCVCTTLSLFIGSYVSI
jgi:hypothetical protein